MFTIICFILLVVVLLILFNMEGKEKSLSVRNSSKEVATFTHLRETIDKLNLFAQKTNLQAKFNIISINKGQSFDLKIRSTEQFDDYFHLRANINQSYSDATLFIQEIERDINLFIFNSGSDKNIVQVDNLKIIIQFLNHFIDTYKKEKTWQAIYEKKFCS